MNDADRKLAWAHICELAAEFDIKVHATKRRWDSEAHLTTRQVFVPRQFRSVVDYLVALHELGHIASSLAYGLYWHVPDREAAMAAEATAWAWAVDRAKPKLLGQMTAEDWGRVGSALTSFLRVP